MGCCEDLKAQIDLVSMTSFSLNVVRGLINNEQHHHILYNLSKDHDYIFQRAKELIITIYSIFNESNPFTGHLTSMSILVLVILE